MRAWTNRDDLASRSSWHWCYWCCWRPSWLWSRPSPIESNIAFSTWACWLALPLVTSTDSTLTVRLGCCSSKRASTRPDSFVAWTNCFVWPISAPTRPHRPIRSLLDLRLVLALDLLFVWSNFADLLSSWTAIRSISIGTSCYCWHSVVVSSRKSSTFYSHDDSNWS